MERREKCFSNLILLFFLLAFIWVLLQFIAPFALPENSVRDLSGLVALSDNDYLIQEMAFPWNGIYSWGDRLCHQQADRSFFINGNQMPFCSRCTAIWLGIALGLGLMVFYRIDVDERFIGIILLGLVPIGIDGGGQLLGLWVSNNSIRVLTGLLAGGVCGLTIGIIIDEIKTLKQTISN